MSYEIIVDTNNHKDFFTTELDTKLKFNYKLIRIINKKGIETYQLLVDNKILCLEFVLKDFVDEYEGHSKILFRLNISPDISLLPPPNDLGIFLSDLFTLMVGLNVKWLSDIETLTDDEDLKTNLDFINWVDNFFIWFNNHKVYKLCPTVYNNVYNRLRNDLFKMERHTTAVGIKFLTLHQTPWIRKE